MVFYIPTNGTLADADKVGSSFGEILYQLAQDRLSLTPTLYSDLYAGSDGIDSTKSTSVDVSGGLAYIYNWGDLMGSTSPNTAKWGSLLGSTSTSISVSLTQANGSMILTSSGTTAAEQKGSVLLLSNGTTGSFDARAYGSNCYVAIRFGSSCTSTNANPINETIARLQIGSTALLSETRTTTGTYTTIAGKTFLLYFSYSGSTVTVYTENGSQIPNSPFNIASENKWTLGVYTSGSSNGNNAYSTTVAVDYVKAAIAGYAGSIVGSGVNMGSVMTYASPFASMNLGSATGSSLLISFDNGTTFTTTTPKGVYTIGTTGSMLVPKITATMPTSFTAGSIAYTFPSVDYWHVWAFK